MIYFGLYQPASLIHILKLIYFQNISHIMCCINYILNETWWYINIYLQRKYTYSWKIWNMYIHNYLQICTDKCYRFVLTTETLQSPNPLHIHISYELDGFRYVNKQIHVKITLVTTLYNSKCSLLPGFGVRRRSSNVRKTYFSNLHLCNLMA